MRHVSKDIFLNTLVCPTLGWILRNEDIPGLTDFNQRTVGEIFRIEQGIELGQRARSLASPGILIEDRDFDGCCTQTLTTLSDPATTAIFEGAFQNGPFRARADLLTRLGHAWKLTEVKSSVEVKREQVDDLAYSLTVLQTCALEVVNASLFTVSRDYRLGMSQDHLFVESDLTAEATVRAGEFAAVMGQVDALTGGVEKPAPELKFACRNCPVFLDCTGKGIDHHIFEIPRLSESKFSSLKVLQISTVLHLPDEFALTENQRRMSESVRNGQPHVSATLAEDLGQVEWPAHYLDFEVVSTGIPLYPDVAPYQGLPFQYSIHQCDDVDQIAGHREFLADGSTDPRREFAERLVQDLDGSGSILVYTGFEKRIMNALADHFPDLNHGLNGIIERLMDLHEILSKNYYHPEFHGSTSLKTTLPVLVPDMSLALAFGFQVKNQSSLVWIGPGICRHSSLQRSVSQI